MNKRGQFFLIAALIIVSILFGLGTIYNSAVSAESPDVSNLAKEIKYEIIQKVDSSVILGLEKAEIYSNIEEIAEIYGASTSNAIIVLYGIKGDFHTLAHNTQDPISFQENENQDIALDLHWEHMHIAELVFKLSALSESLEDTQKKIKRVTRCLNEPYPK